MRIGPTLASIALTALFAGPAMAKCPEPTEGDLDARVAAVEGIFEAHQGNMNLWWSGFMGLHMTMAATMGTLLNYQDTGARRESLVGLVGSGLGASTLLLVTPPLLERSRRLTPLPRETLDQKKAWLRTAEAMLADQAKKSRFATSWLARGLALAYSTGASLFIWLALDRPRGAIRHFVGGFAIGQGRIWLHPTGAADAWDAYYAKYVVGCGEGPALDQAASHPSPRFNLGASSGGLGLTIRF